MSYGPNSGMNAMGIFGRPIPQPRQSMQGLYGMFGIPQQQPQTGLNQQQQNVQSIYSLYGLPTQGMYTPNEGLVRNSMMLGLRSPFQSLGYGPAPSYNRYVPPPQLPDQPATQAAAPVETVQQVGGSFGDYA